MEHNHQGMRPRSTSGGSHDHPYYRGRYEHLHDPTQHDAAYYGVVPQRSDPPPPGDYRDFGAGGEARRGGAGVDIGGGVGVGGGGGMMDPYYAMAEQQQQQQQQHQWERQQGGQFFGLGGGGGLLNGGIGAGAPPPEEMMHLRQRQFQQQQRLAAALEANGGIGGNPYAGGGSPPLSPLLQDMISAQQQQVQQQMQRQVERQMQHHHQHQHRQQHRQQQAAPGSPYGSNPAALWRAQVDSGGGGGRPMSAGQQRRRSSSETGMAWCGGGARPASSPSSAPSSPSTSHFLEPRRSFPLAAPPASAASAAALPPSAATTMDLSHHTTRSPAMPGHGEHPSASVSILGGGRMGFGPPHREHPYAAASDGGGGGGDVADDAGARDSSSPPTASLVDAAAGGGHLDEFEKEDAVPSSSYSSSLSLSSAAPSPPPPAASLVLSAEESKSAAPMHDLFAPPSSPSPSPSAPSPSDAMVAATTEGQPRSSSPPPPRRRRGRPPKKKDNATTATTAKAKTVRTRRNGKGDAKSPPAAAFTAAASRRDDAAKDGAAAAHKLNSAGGVASAEGTAVVAPPERRWRPPVHDLFTATTAATANGDGEGGEKSSAGAKNDGNDSVGDGDSKPAPASAPSAPDAHSSLTGVTAAPPPSPPSRPKNPQQSLRQRPLVLRHDLFASSPSSPLPVVVGSAAAAAEGGEPMPIPSKGVAEAEAEAAGVHAGLMPDGAGALGGSTMGGAWGCSNGVADGAHGDGGGRVKKRRRTKKKGKKRPPRNDGDGDDDEEGEIGGGEGGAPLASRSFLSYLGGGRAGDDGVVGKPGAGPGEGVAHGGGGGDDRDVAMVAESTSSGRKGNKARKRRRKKGGGGQIIVQVDSFLGGGDGRRGDTTAATAAASSGPARDGGGRMNGGDATSPPSPRAEEEEEDSSPVSVREQGYFEGVAPLSLPEDGTYLTETHRLARANLEVFSATALDVMDAKPGRRGPIVVGTIGIRCVHCAEKVREQRRNSLARGGGGDADYHHVTWTKKGTVDRRAKGGMAGSVSYPVTVDGLYSLCAQKPNLHFAKCPNLPADVRAEFAALGGDGRSNRGYSRGGTSAKVYYVQAARRIGLVDVPSGIRFGRDPNLPPLPFDADSLGPQRPQLQQHAELRGKALGQPKDAEADFAGDAGNDGASASLPRISDTVTQRTSDEEIERILRSSAMGNEEGLILVTPDHRHYVTDFVYLLMLQMGIYHATVFDLSNRSSRVQRMEVGYAGLCCRHCANGDSLYPSAGAPVPQPGGSGKFFYSAPDNIASGTGTAFYTHITKCTMVPEEVRHLLPRLKNIHVKQRALLPHGSQRRFFRYIWNRLREADKVHNPPPSTSVAKQLTISGEDSDVDGFKKPGECVDEPSETDAEAGVASFTAASVPNLELQQIHQEVRKDPTDPKESVAENGRKFKNGQNDSRTDADGVNVSVGVTAKPYVRALVVGNGDNLASCNGGKGLVQTQPMHIDDAILRRYAFVRGRSGWLTCKRCRMVPLDLRADGSILAPPVSLDTTNPQEDGTSEASIRSHHSICRGDDFDLSSLVSTVEMMTSAIPGMTFETLIQPSFKALVRALVGGNDDLETVFTDGILMQHLLMQPEVETVSTVDIDGHMLWRAFPSNIDKDDVGKALQALVCFLVEDGKAEGICLEGLLTSNSFIDFVNIVCQGAVYELPSIDDFPADD